MAGMSVGESDFTYFYNLESIRAMTIKFAGWIERQRIFSLKFAIRVMKSYDVRITSLFPHGRHLGSPSWWFGFLLIFE